MRSFVVSVPPGTMPTSVLLFLHGVGEAFIPLRDEETKKLYSADPGELVRRPGMRHLFNHDAAVGRERLQLWTSGIPRFAPVDTYEIAVNLSNLAGLLAARGEVLEVEQLYIRGLRIRERILGDGHPEVTLVLNNLAMLYESCGRREEAKRSVERALSILEGAVGPTAQDTDLPKRLRQAPEEAPAIRAADTAAHARRRMRKSR